MNENVFHHNHGIYEGCTAGCPAYNWWEKDDHGHPLYPDVDEGAWNDISSDKTIQNLMNELSQVSSQTSYTNQAPNEDEKDEPSPSWYPLSPLNKSEEAFLWIGDKNMSESDTGTVLTDTNGHWRIIDRNVTEPIYSWIQSVKKSKTPMLWGYVLKLRNDSMAVKFITHLVPEKQDLEYIQPCLRDLEKKFHRKVIDYDADQTVTPIVESFTPTTVNTGAQRAPILPLENTQGAEPQESDEFRIVRSDTLKGGVVIETLYLASIAANKDLPFEIIVFNGDINTETHFARNEREALNIHYGLVDQYNRAALNDNSQPA